MNRYIITNAHEGQVATDRKTLTLGVIGLRTDRTANELSSDESYSNISVFQEIGQLLLPGLKQLSTLIKTSRTERGDAISAIVVALHMITKYCKKLKYKREIILVTNGRGSIDPDDVSTIAEKMKADDVKLIVLGVDFDDVDYEFKEEDKDDEKAANEATFKTLVEDCDGVFGTMQQAIDELGTPRLKLTRPVPSYKGLLTLGDPSKYESALCIDVERYPRIMIRRPMTASQFVQRSDLSNKNESPQSSATVQADGDPLAGLMQGDLNSLTNVKNARTYQVMDEEAPGGKKDVGRDDLAKGYEYGRTAVHISESDLNVTRLETQAGLEILGFIPWSNYDRYMSMSVSCIIIGQKSNTTAIMALSSLIHALVELESYAIARLVPKTDKAPVIVLLAPSLEPDYECLLDVQLPFTEDVRSYKFPPLDRVLTISGKTITSHRNLPTPALTEAMSAYVDRMDLSTHATDPEGNPTEYMPMTETFSPILHRLNQAIRHRAVHPTDPIPPPAEILTRYSIPPASLLTNSAPQLAALITASSVKKVPLKAHSRKRARDEIKPLSGLDVSGLLSSRPKPQPSSKTKPPSSSLPQISAQNPIPEFKQALDATTSPADIRTLALQFAAIIESRIRTSFSNLAYPRALEELRVLRQEMVEMEEPGVWNEILRGLKGRMVEREELGGERREMWRGMRKEGLGLLNGEGVEVGEEEARGFWAVK